MKRKLRSLSPGEREIVDNYWPYIWEGIDWGTKYDNLDEFERVEEVKESFEYALVIQSIEYILQKKPSKSSVMYWAQKLTWRRKPSWYLSRIRQRENIQLAAKPFEMEFDEEGEIVNIGLSETEWQPLVNPPDPFSIQNPEEYMIAVGDYHKIKALPGEVGSMERRKHAKLNQKILEMQFDGIKVLPKHGPLLGIPEDKVAVFKFHMKKDARKIIAKGDNEMEDKQTMYDTQKGREWEIKKSTFPERRAYYRDSNYEEPRLIRDWKVIKGGSGQDEVVPDPELSIQNSEAINDDIAA